MRNVHPLMKRTEYRHEAPRDVALERLVRAQPEGRGVSVLQVPPYWDVVARLNTTTDKIEYIVTDCSRPDPAKPVREFGPDTRAKCEEFARSTQRLFLSTRVQFAADDIEANLWGGP